MRFTIEQRHLTDDNGKPVTAPDVVTYHICEADTVDEAVRLFVRKQDAEVIGNVLTFPGFQAVATVRGATGVYTLQFTPTSERHTG
ncbi:MAG TPA: hypothetical protein VNA04_17105 [Thermoanaerobaculia bacterium]|nr:hypothetical protein [Thermoanaerobaculia bacterium]